VYNGIAIGVDTSKGAPGGNPYRPRIKPPVSSFSLSNQINLT